jgi:hypothetical protein
MKKLLNLRAIARLALVNLFIAGIADAQVLPESDHKNWGQLSPDHQQIFRETGYSFHKAYVNVKKYNGAALSRCERDATNHSIETGNKILKDTKEKSTSKKEIEEVSNQIALLGKQAEFIGRTRCLVKTLMVITTLKTGSPSVELDHWIDSSKNFDFEDLTDKAKSAFDAVLLENFEDFLGKTITFEKLTKAEWSKIAKELNIPAAMLETFRPVRTEKFNFSLTSVNTTLIFFPSFFDLRCVEEGSPALIMCYPK